MSAILKGMTWSHPRGYDPMVACARLWKEKTGVEVVWEKRSLQGFESFPVETLAREYDLIVIDHPHVGQVTAEGCLAPLDVDGHGPDRQALADASVGASFRSYTWEGRQWALPVDAAAQVQAWRPDLIDHAPATWDAVLELARNGGVLLPLKTPHALMVFYTLAGNIGRPCAISGPGDLIDVETGMTVFGMMRELTDLIDPACFAMDPIDASEALAEGSQASCAPLLYGYVNYAFDGFRPHRLRFADIPTAGDLGPVGSVIGGTGVAVSASSAFIREAIDFAYWVASGDVQCGPYAAAGGQPGHAEAWESDEVNAPANGFYRDTRKTMEGGWVRPRHDGYMAFQAQASDRILEALRNAEDGDKLVADLNHMFAGSFRTEAKVA